MLTDREKLSTRRLMCICHVCPSDEDMFQPDIAFISNERIDITPPDGVHGAPCLVPDLMPDLVIEALSPGTERRDVTIQIIKRERYDAFDVCEYWLANPIAKAITVLRLRNGKFEHVGMFAEGMTGTPPLLDLRVDVSEVFD